MPNCVSVLELETHVSAVTRLASAVQCMYLLHPLHVQYSERGAYSIRTGYVYAFFGSLVLLLHCKMYSNFACCLVVGVASGGVACFTNHVHCMHAHDQRLVMIKSHTVYINEGGPWTI